MNFDEYIKNQRIRLINIFIFTVVIVAFFLNQILQNIENRYLEETTKTYTIAYNTVYNQYKEISDLTSSGLIVLTDAKNIFRKFHTMNIKSQNKVRKEFYEKVNSRYQTLKSKHIKSINFILNDNTMFLKMNSPKDFGMDISKNRYLIHNVHKNKKMIDSYEMGDHGEGYKFLYPIMDKDNYLGLIEITFGAEAITSTIMKQYNVWSNFFIRGTNFNHELLKTQKDRYKMSPIDGYIFDLNVLKVLDEVTKITQDQRVPIDDVKKQLDNDIKNNIFKSYYNNSVSQVYTTIPILHKITKDQEAVVFIRSKHEVLNIIYNNYYLVLVAIIILLVLLFIIIYQKIAKNIFKQKLLIEKHEKEKELKADILVSKNELKRIFDNAQVGLLYISQERKLLKANDELASIFGYKTPDEMIGISMQELHLSHERFVDFGKENFKSLQMGKKHHIEYELKRKDGSSIWCELSGKAFDDAIPADLSKGVLWVIVDISLRKEYQDKLKQQRDEFETIFNYSQDGIVIIDLEGNFLTFNEAFLNTLKYSRGELYTKNCFELTAGEDKQRNERAINAAIQDGEVENFEKKCQTATGEFISVNLSISLLPDKQRLLMILKNITSMKLMQEQSKLAAMGEMIGNIAHQWRQPLSIISTAATGVLMQKEYNILQDKDLENMMNQINNSAQFLSQTIDDFRGLIRGDIKHEKFNLSSNIQKTLGIEIPILTNNNIELITDFDESITIDSFPNALIQSMINVINNAKDALVESKVEKKYIFITTKKENNEVFIDIKDNAGGIPEDIITHIFEPYFTTKHKSQGTGLGLSMTYNMIVKDMKGDVLAKNIVYEYDKVKYQGAYFTIMLPA